MTDAQRWGYENDEQASVEDAFAPAVTITLTGFEMRVLEVILQHLIAGQPIDPSTLDYGAMVGLDRQLKEPPRPGAR